MLGVASALIFVNQGWATDITGQTNGWMIHGSLKVEEASKYIAFRVDRALATTPVLQTTLSLELPADVFLEVFDSHAWSDRKDQRLGNELDLAIGKRFRLGRWCLSPAFRWMNEPSLGQWGAEDIAVFSGYLTGDFRPCRSYLIRPEALIEWMAHPDVIERHGTAVTRVGMIQVWKDPIDIPLLDLRCRTSAARDSGWGKNDPAGVFFQLDGGLDWTVGSHILCTLPGLKVIAPLTSCHDGRRTQSAVLASLKYSF